MSRLKRGLVHVYTGEGKGKTTAALGLGLRACGCKLKVCFFQFFKDGGFPCGEADAVRRFGRNFKFKRFNISHPCFKKTPAAILAPKIKKALDEARQVIDSGAWDVVILDETLIGCGQNFIDERTILDIIRNKPRHVELVLTGRGASKRIIARADYATEMKVLKHPFKNGISARKGIEF
jgi:cob(I)alamin adenosyltransferase